MRPARPAGRIRRRVPDRDQAHLQKKKMVVVVIAGLIILLAVAALIVR